MLRYEKISFDNMDLATKVQLEIFPEESAYEHFKYTINKNEEYENYFLVYEDNDIVGLTGLYSDLDLEETNSIWLGWFGVLAEYRNKGIGKKILLDTIEMAKNLMDKYPIKYIRLYTSSEENPLAQPLFQKVMDIKEEYNNEQDFNYNGSCLIYSKSLINEIVPYWNNKFLNLGYVIEEQEKGNLRSENMRKIDAVIFDMDGLMIDTERLWLESALKTNEVYGYNVPKELIIECIGKRHDATVDKFKEVLGEDFDTDKFFSLSRELKDKEIKENGIDVKKGLFELLNYLKEHNIKMAVASSTRMEGIKSRLAIAGIDESQFTSIISGDMVDKPKPNPEVYLKSCEVLGVKPENTIALEDSDYGIKAAHLAGTYAVLIPDLKVVTEDMRNDAYVVLKDLSEVIDLIENM